MSIDKKHESQGGHRPKPFKNRAYHKSLGIITNKEKLTGDMYENMYE